MIELSPSQQEAISEIDHNLQIIACAGSGKTEVITRRIINILKSKPDVRPENIVAFTFTEKAAENMKRRIASAYDSESETVLDSMYVGTIHAFCKDMLFEFSKEFEGFQILDTVKENLFISRYSRRPEEIGLDLFDFSSLRSEELFSSCIQKLIDEYDNREMWPENCIKLFETYRKCLYSHKYITFDFLIFEALQQIENSETVREYLSQIKYLVVDEYQDVDDLQARLTHEIASFGANVCVVGDDDQTIYQFRGSNARNIIEFSNCYENVVQVKLEMNYRSVKEIVDVANTVIENNTDRLSKEMKAQSNDSGKVEIIATDDLNSEYDTLVERIMSIHNRGCSFSNMAILIRKRKNLKEICRKLQGSGIPYEADETEVFFEGEYLQVFKSIIQFVSDMNKADLMSALSGYATAEGIKNGFRSLRQVCRGSGDGNQKPLCVVMDGFINASGFLDEGDENYECKLNDLTCFKQILSDVDVIYKDYQLEARARQVILFIEKDAAEVYRSFPVEKKSSDAVNIMTIHKSKGLEFDTVFLPDVEKKIFPSGKIGGKKYWKVLGDYFERNKDKYEGIIEDERKLFYVAATRAKKNLFILFETSKRVISPFVVEAAEADCVEFDATDYVYEKKLDHRGIKEAIIEFYGPAAVKNLGARAELERIRSIRDENELISEARLIGINVDNYVTFERIDLYD